jgi:DNA-binding GntR family transcriptional regulator
VVREALSRLDRAGLIHKDEQLRWRVTPLTATRLRDLYELRRALEPVALRRAAARPGIKAKAADMRDRLAALTAGSAVVAAAELQPFERELHIDILSLCGNPEILQALRIAQVQLVANRGLFEIMWRFYPEIVSEHLAIADCLANGQTSRAEALLAAHLDERRSERIEEVLWQASVSLDGLPAYLRRE